MRVKAGLAWFYREYAPTDKTLARLEAEARKAKRGLWADPKPMLPCEWRQSPRAKQKTEKPPANASGKYWLNTVSNVRHNSACKWFRNTTHGRPCGAGEGKACKLCGG